MRPLRGVAMRGRTAWDPSSILQTSGIAEGRLDAALRCVSEPYEAKTFRTTVRNRKGAVGIYRLVPIEDGVDDGRINGVVADGQEGAAATHGFRTEAVQIRFGPRVQTRNRGPGWPRGFPFGFLGDCGAACRPWVKARPTALIAVNSEGASVAIAARVARGCASSSSVLRVGWFVCRCTG